MNEVRKLLESRAPGLHACIEQALVDCEADFNRRKQQAPSEFLVDHSRQTAAIAHLLAVREDVFDGYDRPCMEQALSSHFTIDAAVPLLGSGRVLYCCSPRE